MFDIKIIFNSFMSKLSYNKITKFIVIIATILLEKTLTLKKIQSFINYLLYCIKVV